MNRKIKQSQLSLRTILLGITLLCALLALVVSSNHFIRLLAMDDDFDEEFRKTQSESIEIDDPQSVQEGINRWYELSRRFPDHPRTPECELQIVDILRTVNSKESLAQAAPILGRLAETASPGDSLGQRVLLAFVDFHLIDAKNHSFQSLTACETKLRRLDTQTGNDRADPLYLRIGSRLATLHNVQGDFEAAADLCIERLKQLSTEESSKLVSYSPSELRRYQYGVNEVVSSACVAVERSSGKSVTQKFRNDPMLLFGREVLADYVEARERKADSATASTDSERPWPSDDDSNNTTD